DGAGAVARALEAERDAHRRLSCGPAAHAFLANMDPARAVRLATDVDAARSLRRAHRTTLADRPGANRRGAAPVVAVARTRGSHAAVCVRSVARSRSLHA